MSICIEDVVGKWTRYFITSFSSRRELKITDISIPFLSNFKEKERNHFDGSIEFVEWCNHVLERSDELDAFGDFLFFNESEIVNSKNEHVALKNYLRYYADTVPELMINDLLDKENANSSLWTCCIEMFYASPDAPDNCVEEYFFKNIEKIIKHCFCVDVRCFVIYPRLFEPAPAEKTRGLFGVHDDWIESPDADGELLKKKLSILKMAGFTKLENSEYYVKICV